MPAALPTQLALPIDRQYIAGQHAIAGIPADDLRRLRERGLVKPGFPFYCLINQSGHAMTWTGKGMKPGWVRHWLEMGGSVDELRATL
jgi:DNA-binding protein H-NS